MSAAATPSHVAHDDVFQAACQRYAHANGTSQAIAASALRAAGVVHGAIVLQALPPSRPMVPHDAYGQYEIGEAYEAPGWIRISPSHGSRWRPGKWVVDERRSDADGREWSRMYPAVVNDFGDLVEVAA